MRLLPSALLGRRIRQGKRGLADEICVFLKKYEGGSDDTTHSRPPQGGVFREENEGWPKRFPYSLRNTGGTYENTSSRAP